jgi:hypothetical protein
MDVLRELFRTDGRGDLADDDQYLMDIILSGKENDYLHPERLTKEEEETLQRLTDATLDRSLTPEQHDRACKALGELQDELESSGKLHVRR